MIFLPTFTEFRYKLPIRPNGVQFFGTGTTGAVAKKISGDAITKQKNVTYATGKRKDSVARVYIAPGKGVVVINDMPMNEYFRRAVLQMIIAGNMLP